MVNTEPATFGLSQYWLHTLAARVVLARCFFGVAADHIAPRAARGTAWAGEVGSEELRLTGSSQRWLLTEGGWLEGHWIDIHWCSDAYASFPWSETIKLQLGGNGNEDRLAPSLERWAPTDRTTLHQTNRRENVQLGAAIGEADIETLLEASPQRG